MTERKKILIFVDWFLPGTKSGGPVRSYANMIAHLGKYHDFYLVTRDTDYCSTDVYNSVESNSWNQLNNHTFVYYFSKEQLNTANLKSLLAETPFDIAYINGMYSWFFSILPLWLLRKRKNVIVAARGMLNPQAFSVKPFKKKLFIGFAKRFKLYKNVTFHATNHDEANYITQRIGNGSEVKIAPNLPRISENTHIELKPKHEPTKFVNIARISIEKGTLKMIQGLKGLKNHTVLDIYGPIYDTHYWEQCVNEIKHLPSQVSVNYKGVLPSEDVPEVLQEYDFFVLLSEGENFGHAILEAFSAGCPVIISDQTPWKDLQAKHIGWDIATHNIEHITAVYKSAISMAPNTYKEQSLAAFEFSRAFIENPEVLQMNLGLFELN